MSVLRFPYLPVPIVGLRPPTMPPTALVRYRPLAPIVISNPATGASYQYNEAVIDSGADDSVFPLRAVAQLRLMLLATVGLGHQVRWRGAPWPLQFGDVQLRLDDGVHSCYWLARVAFSLAPMPFPILGQAGCLQYFNATFRGEDRLTELEPIPAFPGNVT